MLQCKFQQIMFRFVLTVGGLFASALTSRAQTPVPSGPTLSDHIARLTIKAAQLLPYLQSEADRQAISRKVRSTFRDKKAGPFRSPLVFSVPKGS